MSAGYGQQYPGHRGRGAADWGRNPKNGGNSWVICPSQKRGDTLLEWIYPMKIKALIGMARLMLVRERNTTQLGSHQPPADLQRKPEEAPWPKHRRS